MGCSESGSEALSLTATGRIAMVPAEKGETPLFVASYLGNDAVVRELLSNNQTDPNQARTSDGTTPLFIASENGYLEVVRELLADKRVDPNQARTYYGDSPFLIACE